MPIELTKIIEQTTQADGVQRVQVAFIDHLRKEHRRSFDFPKGADIDKAIQGMVVNIEQGLKDQEIEQTLGKIDSFEPFILEHASDADLKTRLMEYGFEKQIEIDRLTSEKINVSAEEKEL